MSLNSYAFIFAFLPITAAGYLLLVRFASRNAIVSWIVGASAVFYGICSLRSFILIIPSILLDYLIVRILLSNVAGARLRTFVFILGITVNIAFLGYFKYRNFFLETANSVFSTNFDVVRIALPLGISFLTFQKLSLLSDVHSGDVRSISLLDYLLFTLFFPRTIAGPIVRYKEIAPQLSALKETNVIADIVVGGCLFSIGLFKKTVIADSLLPFVTLTFDKTWWLFGNAMDMLTAWTGVLSYTFQLYFDFSGYSDMAIGIARIFGVKLPMNFNSPYKASSIVEYWNRWHITLTRFLTSYIYTPVVLTLTRVRLNAGKSILRGKRSSLSAMAVLVAFPTFLTMTISGIWHGAGWQFIVWGVLHGLYIIVNQTWRMVRPRFWADEVLYVRVMKPVGFVLTFSCVMIALVLFRSDSVRSALSILGAMIGLNGVLPYDVQLLKGLGANTPWDAATQWLVPTPIPFIWVIALFLGVTLLPNSLELLRGFQSALDFPLAEPTEPAKLPTSVGPAGQVPASATTRLRAVRAYALRIRSEGISLSGVVAAIIALAFVLAILADNRGEAFVYGQF